MQHKLQKLRTMQPIKTLNDMIVFLQQRGDKKRVAVVCANDASTRYAVEKGKEMGFIEPIYVDGEDKDECARRAVALCKNGEADILMKGLINTDVILRAILDKENGILRFPSMRNCSTSQMQQSSPCQQRASVASRSTI